MADITRAVQVEMNTVIKFKGQFKYNTPLTRIYFPSKTIFSDILIGNVNNWGALSGAALRFDLYVNNNLAVTDFIPTYTILPTEVMSPSSIMPIPTDGKMYLGGYTLSDIVQGIIDGKYTTGDKAPLLKIPKEQLGGLTYSIVPTFREKPPAPPSGGGTAPDNPITTATIGLTNSYLRLLFEYISLS